MIEVGQPTTKRKPLTKLQRAKVFAAHNGICVICSLPVDPRKPWIDEHIRALGLNGTNDLSNRGPAHFHCAGVKTKSEDMPRITKAQAQQASFVGRDPEKKSKIKNRPPSSKPKREPKPDFTTRRALFVDRRTA